MFSLIARIVRASFLLFMFLVIAPTLIFLTKWYYAHLISKKTYIGVINLPSCIEKSEEVISSAKTLFSSHEIKGVIIKCNGNGGNVGACEAIHTDLTKLKELYKKPLLAYCERECFGGSYAIATSADVIIATPGALIGNIGEFYCEEKNNIFYITPDTIKQQHEQQYLDIIAHSRKQLNIKSLGAIKKNTISGKQAYEYGLIDVIGGNLEIEKIMRTKTVIEGSLEEVHGSLAYHFITSISDIINKIIRGIHL
jgi:ClpP class serine protease